MRSSQNPASVIKNDHANRPTASATFNVPTDVACVGLVLPWLLHLLATDILLSLLLCLSFISPSFVYHASSRLAFRVWKGIQGICTEWNGARITTSGQKLPRNESAIVIANHVSWTDFYLIQELAMKANMLPYCRWFAKQQLRWVPFLGWGLKAMGMPSCQGTGTKIRRHCSVFSTGPSYIDGQSVSSTSRPITAIDSK